MTKQALASPTPVRDHIHQLASQNNVVYVKTPGDHVADAYARLSDCETYLDETECLLLQLERSEILDRDEGRTLLGKYLDEIGEF